MSLSLDADSIARSVVGALTPALQSAMPSLVDAAWPAVQARLPTLVPQVVDFASAQLPALIDKAMPTLYAKLPEIKQKIMPLVQAETDALVDSYVRKYMGPAYLLKEYAPALTILATSLTLFASGIIIYQFWAGER